MGIAEQLKQAMREYGSVYRVAKDSGISQTALQRFMSGERDIRLETAAAVCVALGLELRPTQKTKRKG